MDDVVMRPPLQLIPNGRLASTRHPGGSER